MGKTKRLKWYEAARGEDIKFRGPLSYRHFKAIGWLLFVLQQAGMLMALGMQFDPGMAKILDLPYQIIDAIAPLSLAFLLFATFGTLLTENDYKKRLLVNGAAALGIACAFLLLINRYVVGVVDAFVGDVNSSRALVDDLLSSVGGKGYISFNIFIDLFLCTLFMFFLNYKPQKYFQGTKIRLFRACALLPIAYEAATIFLKFSAASGNVLSVNFFPFLPAKPPMMFFVFTVFCLFMKRRERQFCEHGGTPEEYKAYLLTNRNSFDFAKFAAIVCLAGGLLDAFIVLGGTFSSLASNPGSLASMSAAEQEAASNSMMQVFLNTGFGGAADLIFMAPIMLLFSYTRTYKDKTVDLLIPVVAFALLIIMYLEAMLIAAQQLPMMLAGLL